MIYYKVTVEKNADTTFKDMTTLEFSITFARKSIHKLEQFSYLSSYQNQKNATEGNDKDTNTITVNNFFAHWVY